MSDGKDNKPDIAIALQYDGRNAPRVTAKGEDVDRIVGLEMGADDYLVKPFNPRELTARIRAIFRRVRQAGPDRPCSARSLDPALPARRLHLDHSRRRASLDGSQLELRPREYELLRFLSEHPGQVFSRDSLLSHVWGYDAFIGPRTVDVHVAHLRDKLEGSGVEIETVWGVGYKLVAIA